VQEWGLQIKNKVWWKVALLWICKG
jgi:hypothetical protein